MKNIALLFTALSTAVACTKSETQYYNQENKRQTVNNRQSDTIKTLTETSDTIQMGAEKVDLKTDNE
ncbi:hypothetical protein [Chryseobacterium indoltheticum]|uniref:Lipoprotein n=1 Tax=Chryseobacterium indoltheticum TaxID=254 RepID=A0A381FF10_9FLAO|nr:hypothetical protein [Chryseobacterium indoltheticum]AZA74309.1 hypothetical protein EG358_11345 [Chryseobacterium indoltheticum]SIQ02111.1 hypothetical protein SAMN05421682_10240 [Chryseobacterium indoltheticum]SUX45139.1 Uncharacterised protein [Chryseobacterium indoltheticum]